MNAPSTDPPKHNGPYVPCKEDCPYHRVGLPIFPVRYSVLRNNEHSPAPLSGDLLASSLVSADKNLGASARYGLRLLRPGYLYVYDEARKVLEGYFVNGDNTLYKFNVDKPLKDGENNFPCKTAEHQAMASMITIPDANRATRVWLTLSDVQWTKATCDRHRGTKGEAERKKHMFEFDVQAWLGAKKHPQASAITGIRKWVAEYFSQSDRGMDHIAQQEQYDWSTVNWMSRLSWMSGLVEQAADWYAPGKGVMLALSDPTGIAQDIARLMTHGYQAFTQNQADIRQLTVSKSIEGLREAIANQAETDLLASADEAADNMEISGTISSAPGGDGPDMAPLAVWIADQLIPGNRKRRMEQAEKIRHPGAAERETARRNSWKDYLDKYDENARLKWQADFDKRLKEFDVGTIVPLATAHVAWMKGPDMVCGFQCNYDPLDVDSGSVYQVVFLLCIAGIQDKRVCFDMLLDWLVGRETDTANLLLRAMVLNQTPVAEKVEEAATLTIDWKGIRWYDIAAVYGRAVERLSKNQVDRAAVWLKESLGPITRVLNSGVDHPSARAMAVRIGVITRTPVQIVEVVGSKKKFRAALIREILNQSAGKVDQRKLERAVAAELRRYEVAGEQIDGTDKKRWFRLVDSEAAARVPASGDQNARAAALAQATMSIEQYEAIDMANWRKVVNTDVRVGAANTVFQVVAVYKMWKDMQNPMDHEKPDVSYKFIAGMISTAGAAAETLGNGLMGVEKLSAQRLGANLGVDLAGNAIRIAGKGTGIVMGLVFAYFDFKTGLQQFNVERNGMMGGLYMASAVLSVGLIAATLWGTAIVGIFLAAALLVIVLVIAWKSDNKIQEWLKRCFWGSLQGVPGGRPYGSLPEEVNNLNVALGNTN
ncbi:MULTISPECIES: T6SS effector BTH_I2691 family protein [unclassified Achromobacter]|uniref:T6SS effector BTH_I2691 family protein n=1 Tax=unclassified Achromobacter TaxID=2626865 RepID=UPI000B51D1CF|nr:MULTISPECIES: T6SS effector BTH_I2691 family protein [unclassified Achromobacter]OWT69130.1 hypothetical protein CEY05_28245 [Achromobacter sp. HZ34]OWT70535.1 hypothetical protein CEY04_27075 [Achromobacter sp. HZ28]